MELKLLGMFCRPCLSHFLNPHFHQHSRVRVSVTCSHITALSMLSKYLLTPSFVPPPFGLLEDRNRVDHNHFYGASTAPSFQRRYSASSLRGDALNVRPQGRGCNFKKRKHGTKYKVPGVGKNVACLRKMLRMLWLGCGEGGSRWHGIGSVRF